MAFLWIFLFSMVAYPNFHPSNQTSLPSASDLALRSCIADLCIFPEDLFINQVAIEYGGSKDANELCYRVEAKGLYLRIRASNHPLEQSGIVESIEIARGGNCSKTIEPKKPFRSLTTSAGLAVGG